MTQSRPAPRTGSLTLRLLLAVVLPLSVAGLAVVGLTHRRLQTNTSELQHALDVQTKARALYALVLVQEDATKALLLEPDKVADYSSAKIEAYDAHRKLVEELTEVVDDPVVDDLLAELSRIDSERLRPLDTRILENLFIDADAARRIYSEEYAPVREEYERGVERVAAELSERAAEATARTTALNRRALFEIGAALALAIVVTSGVMIVLGRRVDRSRALMEAANADLDRRTREMRKVLDHVQQGLVILDPQGRIGSERSAAFDRFFGGGLTAETLAGQLEHFVPGMGERLSLGWEMLVDDVMPRTVSLEQLPRALSFGDRHFTVDYRSIAESDADPFEGALAVFTDVTEARRKEAETQGLRESLSVFTAMRRDPRGFETFLDHSRALILDLLGGALTDRTVLMRHLHTLKGNACLYGLVRTPAVCHELESTALERPLTLADLEQLQQAWGQFEVAIGPFVDKAALRLSGAELGQLRELARDHPPLLAKLGEWLAEPAEVPLRALAKRAEELAQRRGKRVRCTVAASGIRIGDARFGEVWSVLVHVVRNAVDHGIELPSVRAAAGKPEQARIDFVARLGRLDELCDADACRVGAEPGPSRGVAIDVVDDGGGIDLSAIAERAAAKGLPSRTKQQQVEAMFSDGLSTAREVTSTSGRGVGTSSLRSVVTGLGGFVEVATTPGRGTRLTVAVPTSDPATSSPPAPRREELAAT